LRRAYSSISFNDLVGHAALLTPRYEALLGVREVDILEEYRRQ
jgi:hypothetical protein